METNKLKLFSLYQLHDNRLLLDDNDTESTVTYFIDSYQRGYRWNSQQITLLLNDLWEFYQKAEQKTVLKPKEYYCLQPIVVKPKIIEEQQCWEVLDGQQRLTSLKILFRYLLDQTNLTMKEEYDVSDFQINYKTRIESKKFLNNISIECQEIQKNDNIDFYYMSNAYETITKWFDENGIHQKREKRNFLDQLLANKDESNPIKVIWYEVNDETDSYEIFTRLNIGKIKLTNSELIKALFLKRNENNDSSVDKILNEIANDWNALEYKLQNNEFWHFIYNNHKILKFPNRIEYIFDLYCNKTNQSEEYHSFFEMNQKIIDNDVNNESRWLEWQNFKAYFQKIEGWFIDNRFYHFIGFLIAVGYPLNEIIKLSVNKNKDEYLETLRSVIKNEVLNINKDELRDLKYGNKLIFKCLLLFNILTVLSNDKSNYRFSFHLFKSQSWDIEHIRSRNDKELTKENEWKDWIRDIIEYFTNKDLFSIEDYCTITNNNVEEIFYLSQLDKDLSLKIKDLIIKFIEEDFSKSELQNYFHYFRKYFDEDTSEFEKDSIYNLSLLDSYTNRSYGNAFYPIKRRRIQENGKYGIFIPVCTSNVFMKVYSKKLDNLSVWSLTDAESYIDEIVNVLTPFLK